MGSGYCVVENVDGKLLTDHLKDMGWSKAEAKEKSWPVQSIRGAGRAELRGYTTDESNVEWSQEHFNDVVLRLEKMCLEDPSVKLRIFAHSMGTRLIIRD